MAGPARDDRETRASLGVAEGTSEPTISVTAEIARGRPTGPRHLTLGAGATVREAVRVLGVAPEGSATMVEGRPVPLDRALVDGEHLVVVPTFSGG